MEGLQFEIDIALSDENNMFETGEVKEELGRSLLDSRRSSKERINPSAENIEKIREKFLGFAL